MTKLIVENEFERQDLLSAFVDEMDERGYNSWFIGRKLAEVIDVLEEIKDEEK